MYNFSLFSIKIDQKSKKNLSWYKNLSRSIEIQLEGFEKSKNFDNREYIVTFKDFNLLELDESEFIVPSNYHFVNDIYVDIKRKIAIRQKNNKELEYWCKDSYGLSIPFIFQLILVKNQQSFIHSGAFSFKNKGVVMSAFGGIGKTAVLSRVANEENYKIMGDDLNILNSDGSILSYSRPFCLYRYHKPLFKEFYKKNKLKYLRPALFWRVYNKILKELYNITGVDFKVSKYNTNSNGYITASPFNIFNSKDIELKKITLKYAFVIGRHSKSENVLVKQISPEDFSNFSLNVLYHEWDYMDKSLKGYLTFLNIGLSEYLNLPKKNIYNSLSNIECIYRIDLPISMKMEDSTLALFNEMKKIING